MRACPEPTFTIIQSSSGFGMSLFSPRAESMEEMAYVACYCQHRSSRNAFNVTTLLTQPKENDTGVRYGTGPALSCAIAVRKTSPPIRSSRLKMSPGFCNCPRSQADVPSSESKPTIFAKEHSVLQTVKCRECERTAGEVAITQIYPDAIVSNITTNTLRSGA